MPTDNPWWSLRGKERAAAKQQYESEHPLPVQVSRHGGRYVSRSGHAHYYGGNATRRVAEMAARADVPPIDLPAVEVDGVLSWLGQRGLYTIDLSTPERFRASLTEAIEGERAANRPAADPQPAQP